ncbi:MAG TPA: DUF1778 domain-containing protein [Alphaproteobacteria bacterium]|nr:DUF1778 domain-containing protein [Alphaproteobacteria bacterium]
MSAAKRDIAVSMRFRDQDIDIIDRGAELAGVSRSEFVRRAAVQEAQMAILNESVIRVSPEAFEQFVRTLEEPVKDAPAKLAERLARPSPWK